MISSFKSARTTLKIVAMYALTLSTAVACGKFEGKTNIKGGGTSNGTSSVLQDGTPGPMTDSNISIDRIQTIYLGEEIETDTLQSDWSLQMDVTHGSHKMRFNLYPNIAPYNPDGTGQTKGNVEYWASGICGTANCSKFAVMIEATDITNGTDLQRVEYWDLLVNNAAPQRRLTQTDFNNVKDAYEAMSGSKLP